MQEYDKVELIVDKNCYSKRNVHKGMRGTIMDPRKIDGRWLVIFDGTECYQRDDGVWTCNDVELSVLEEDLELVEAGGVPLSEESYRCFAFNPQIIDNVPADLCEVLEKRGELDEFPHLVPNKKEN